MKLDSKDQSHVLTSAFERLSLATNLQMITTTVAEAARALTGADGATFVLREGDLCFYADENAISPLWKGNKFPMQACISGWSMEHGEVVLIEDIYKDARIPHEAYRPTFVKSLCMIPIRPGNSLGAIGNYWKSGHVPSDEEIQLLRTLANSTAIALENLDLKRTIVRDNSARLELKQQAKELEAAIFSMGHDLRTPVSAMTSLAELLKVHLKPYLNDMTAEYLDMIHKTGLRSAEQIERMLSLYRATNGKIEKRQVDLSSLAQETMNQVRLQFPQRRIQTMIEMDLKANADHRLMQMVLENLLSNAVKYSSRKPESKVEVGLAATADGQRTFYVRDNGDGFDDSETHKLFKPLGRLHSDDEFAGTGLGLASVAKIIELHGGQVRAEGRKQQGATFYFSLPG